MGKVAKVSSVIALDCGKQKQFTRAVKKLQRKVRSAPIKERKNTPKDAYLTRGLIYVSHLPHGFFEKQLFQYFKQFGRVTNVRVLRSHNSGKSKGAAFIEFEQPEVAKIAAETMDNYLMFKRRLEAKYIEPDDRHQKTFKVKITSTLNPKTRNQKKDKQMKNSTVSNEVHESRVKRKMAKLAKSGDLEFCQIVKADDIKVKPEKAENKTIETKTSSKKKAAKTAIVELPTQLKGLETIKFHKSVKPTQEVKPTKKAKVTPTEATEGFSDESLIINLPETKPKKKTKATMPFVAVDEKQPKKAKKVAEILKTIKKTKDKKSAGALVLKSQVLAKMATGTTAAKASKAKMMLDSSLVTEVKFNKQKGKKGGISPAAKKSKRLVKK